MVLEEPWVGWLHRLHRAKRELHGDAEGEALRGAERYEGLDVEMGRRLNVIGCIVRIVCLFIGRVVRSFVLRVWIHFLGGWAANHTRCGLLGE